MRDPLGKASIEDHAPPAVAGTPTGGRRVCDVCGARSSGERGSTCRTCARGTMRRVEELGIGRVERRDARNAERESGTS